MLVSSLIDDSGRDLKFIPLSFLRWLSFTILSSGFIWSRRHFGLEVCSFSPLLLSLFSKNFPIQLLPSSSLSSWRVGFGCSRGAPSLFSLSRAQSSSRIMWIFPKHLWLGHPWYLSSSSSLFLSSSCLWHTIKSLAPKYEHSRKSRLLNWLKRKNSFSESLPFLPVLLCCWVWPFSSPQSHWFVLRVRKIITSKNSSQDLGQIEPIWWSNTAGVAKPTLRILRVKIGSRWPEDWMWNWEVILSWALKSFGIKKTEEALLASSVLRNDLWL